MKHGSRETIGRLQKASLGKRRVLTSSPVPWTQFLPSVTELVVAQCYYLDFDDRNRNKPIYVYLNSTGCINDKVGINAG